MKQITFEIPWVFIVKMHVKVHQRVYSLPLEAIIRAVALCFYNELAYWFSVRLD